MADATGSFFHHRQHVGDRQLVQEPVKRSVDDLAHGRGDPAHDRLHVAERTELVTAMNGRRTPEPDDDVLGVVGKADDFVRHDLADRHDRVVPIEEVLRDLDRDRFGESPRARRADLVGRQLADIDETVSPVMHEICRVGNALAEHHGALFAVHGGVGAERRKHAQLADPIIESPVQQGRDLSRARVETSVIGRDE